MPSRRPTDRELAILRVLWDRGPSTVRAVHEALAARHDTGYTTTLKLMQIMTEKGLVRRDEAQRTHVYRAAVLERDAESGAVADLIDRVFGGSTERLVLSALSAKRTSPEELAEIRRLLDRMEEERRRGK